MAFNGLTHFMKTELYLTPLAQYYIYIPPENVRKPKVFRGYRNRNIGLKWVDNNKFNMPH